MLYLRTFARSEDGTTVVEYGLIAGSIAVAIVAALATIGLSLLPQFGSVVSNLVG